MPILICKINLKASNDSKCLKRKEMQNHKKKPGCITKML